MAKRQYSDAAACVYGLRAADASSYFYVGCTVLDPQQRLAAHLYAVASGTHSNRHFSHKVKKIGAKNVVCDVLEVTSLGERWDAERRWIERLKQQEGGLVNRIHNDIGVVQAPATKEQYEWVKRFIVSPPPPVKAPHPALQEPLDALLGHLHETLAVLTRQLEDAGYEFG